MRSNLTWLLAALVLLPACGTRESDAPLAPRTITLTSSAFTEGGAIPKKYSCDGDDVSPPLRWTGVPEKTRSLALVCEDPDAPTGTFTHWVVYNLPPGTTELKEGIARAETVPMGTETAADSVARQGKNDFGKLGFGGPCPPGGTHHYHFKLYALDTKQELAPGASRAQLLGAIRGHVLAEGRLVGTYTR